MDEYVTPAIPLFNLLCSASSIQPLQEVLLFQDKIIATLDDFSLQLSVLTATEKDISIARYWFAAALDEAMLRQAWVMQSRWFHQSLLIRLFNDSRGGVKFYELLEELLQEEAPNRALIFLAYLLLQSGFQGKYIHTTTEERERLLLTLQHRLALHLENRPTPRLMGEAAKIPIRPVGKSLWRKYAWLTLVGILLMNMTGNGIIYGISRELVSLVKTIQGGTHVVD